MCVRCVRECALCVIINSFLAQYLCLPHGYFELEDGGERIWESLCYLPTKDNWGRYIKKLNRAESVGDRNHTSRDCCELVAKEDKSIFEAMGLKCLSHSVLLKRDSPDVILCG